MTRIIVTYLYERVREGGPITRWPIRATFLGTVNSVTACPRGFVGLSLSRDLAPGTFGPVFIATNETVPLLFPRCPQNAQPVPAALIRRVLGVRPATEGERTY